MKSRLDGDIVWIEIEGEFLADEMISESKKWYATQQDKYIGYIVDIRKMTKQNAVEQKKVEEEAKTRGTSKPRAILGKDAATAAIVNIYQRFTGAQGVHFFTDEESAKVWLRAYKA
jgi:hypothetical protein